MLGDISAQQFLRQILYRPEEVTAGVDMNGAVWLLWSIRGLLPPKSNSPSGECLVALSQFPIESSNSASCFPKQQSSQGEMTGDKIM